MAPRVTKIILYVDELELRIAVLMASGKIEEASKYVAACTTLGIPIVASNITKALDFYDLNNSETEAVLQEV
jgi:uncharacterized protein (UPF0254 family)